MTSRSWSAMACLLISTRRRPGPTRPYLRGCADRAALRRRVVDVADQVDVEARRDDEVAVVRAAPVREEARRAVDHDRLCWHGPLEGARVGRRAVQPHRFLG